MRNTEVNYSISGGINVIYFLKRYKCLNLLKISWNFFLILIEKYLTLIDTLNFQLCVTMKWISFNGQISCGDGRCFFPTKTWLVYKIFSFCHKGKTVFINSCFFNFFKFAAHKHSHIFDFLKPFFKIIGNFNWRKEVFFFFTLFFFFFLRKNFRYLYIKEKKWYLKNNNNILQLQPMF